MYVSQDYLVRIIRVLKNKNGQRSFTVCQRTLEGLNDFPFFFSRNIDSDFA